MPGRDDYFIEHTQAVPEGKTPQLGRSLPVTVSARHPNKLTIDWSRV